MKRMTALGVIWAAAASDLLAQETAPGAGGPANWLWYVLASGVVGIIIGYGIATAMWKGKSSWSNCNKICPQDGGYCDKPEGHSGPHHCPNGHDF